MKSTILNTPEALALFN